MRFRHRQPQILEFIRRSLASNNEAPTIREIGRHFDLGIARVHEILGKMESTGLITRSRKWRGIEIVEQKKAA